MLRSAVTLRSSSTAAAGNGSSSSSLPTGAEQGAEQTSSTRKRRRSQEKKALVRQNTGLSLGDEERPDFRPELAINRPSEKLNLEKEVRLDAWLEELTLEAQKLPQEPDDDWTTRTGLSKGLW